MRIYLIFDLINVNDTYYLHMLNFANSAGLRKLILFFHQVFEKDFENKSIICRNFVAVIAKFLSIY